MLHFLGISILSIAAFCGVISAIAVGVALGVNRYINMASGRIRSEGYVYSETRGAFVPESMARRDSYREKEAELDAREAFPDPIHTMGKATGLES